MNYEKIYNTMYCETKQIEFTLNNKMITELLIKNKFIEMNALNA